MSFARVIQRLQQLESPYPGLRPFDVAESHLFFGRDEQIAELMRRLELRRFVAVLGVSGSGKSSLVRAGLIPALERGGVWEAGRKWRLVITSPGGAPFESLAGSLIRANLDASRLRESSFGLIEAARGLPSDETLLLVVDQFEELFRYKDVEAITPEARRVRDRQAADAAEFVQLLLESTRHHPPIYIVLTMRSDYVGDCAAFRDLPEMLNDCQYLVPRMTRQQRKEAIEGPLGRVRMSTALVQRLLNDVGDEPDHLPILQHALMRTWNQWRSVDPKATREITLEEYQAVGGFEDALNLHANELLDDVPQDIAACILKRLTARGRTSRERRDPTTLATLWAVCGAETPERRSEVTAVIDKFRSGQATFLRPLTGAISPDTYIDITHESLIRLWKRLRDVWLPEEQISARTLREVAERAANRKAGSGELLSGRDLARVVEWDRIRNPTDAWAHHYVDDATLRDVIAYVNESRQREQALLRRQATVRAAVVIVLLAAILGGGIFALRQFREQQAVQLRTAETLKIEAQRAEAATARQLLVAQTDLVQPEMRPAVVNGTAAQSDLQPRVYIQVRSAGEATRAAALGAPLLKVGYVVPKPEVLNTGPSTSELRYFRTAEQSLADRLIPALADEGYFDVRPVYVMGFEQSTNIRPKHLELWLAPDNVPALVQRLNDKSAAVRRAAGRRLERSYLGSQEAVSAALEMLSPKTLPTLSADGRLNALWFLGASQPPVWTDEHRRLAADAAGRIRNRSGVAPVGTQTLNALTRLEQLVAPPQAQATPLPETPIQAAPASSGCAPIEYSAEIADRIRKYPGVPYTQSPPPADDHAIVAIILHDANGSDGDGVIRLIREGRPDMPGPLTHWAVRTDGRIEAIAPETQRANHLGRAAAGELAISNTNTIGIDVVGRPACVDPRQVESLVRLVADIADRWKIPSSSIFSHAEVALPKGRKNDMAQQAPAVREMVSAVRK